MVNPDHMKGGIVGASIIMFAVAGFNLLVGILAAPQLSELITGTGGYAEYTARFAFAYAAVFGVGGLLLLLIGVQPKTRMVMIAVIGFAIMAACMVIITIFAHSPIVHAYGWHLLAGMLGGVATLVFALRRHARLERGPEMFADPSTDWQH